MHTTQHTYGTRIRHNIRIKPSARLRQSSNPPNPKSKQDSPVKVAVFPPPHVVLHPDDANSKVFLALGRSLMSVVRIFYCTTRVRAQFLQNNRAMTIKDLSEMVVANGLVCQK